MINQNGDYGVRAVTDPLLLALGGGPRPTASTAFKWRSAHFYTSFSTDAITHKPNRGVWLGSGKKKGPASSTIWHVFVHWISFCSFSGIGVPVGFSNSVLEFIYHLEVQYFTLWLIRMSFRTAKGEHKRFSQGVPEHTCCSFTQDAFTEHHQRAACQNSGWKIQQESLLSDSVTCACV